MAKTNESSKMYINVITGYNGAAKVISKRTISKINPLIPDEELYAIGKLLASLQEHEFSSIARQDSATIEAN